MGRENKNQALSCERASTDEEVIRMEPMRNLKSLILVILIMLSYISSTNMLQATEPEDAKATLEDAQIQQIETEGIGGCFIISDILPETDTGIVCSFTIKTGTNPENWLLKTVYSKDTIPMKMSQGPLAGAVITGTGSYFTPAGDISSLKSGSVLRFEGKVLLKGFTFEGDEQDPLTFILLEKGLVYVTGKGKVTLKDGRLIALPASK